MKISLASFEMASGIFQIFFLFFFNPSVTTPYHGVSNILLFFYTLEPLTFAPYT